MRIRRKPEARGTDQSIEQRYRREAGASLYDANIGERQVRNGEYGEDAE
jgi:hypothetical protein